MDQRSKTPQTLGDFAAIVWRRKWLFVAVVFVVVASGLAWSLLQSPVYRATTTVIIRSAQAESVLPGLQSSNDPKRRVLNEISVMTGSTVRQRVIDELQLSVVPPAASGSSTSTADVVAVSVNSGNAAFAAQLADAYVAAYVKVKAAIVAERLAAATSELQAKIDDLQGTIDEIDAAIARSSTDDDTVRDAERRTVVEQQAGYRRELDQLHIDAQLIGPAAEVVRPAVVPSTPVSPTPVKTGMLALFGGLLLGLAAVLVRERLDRSIDELADLDKVGTTLPVLAVVPHVPDAGTMPLALHQPRHQAVESYRVLRTSVEFLAVDRQAKVLQVTSAVPAEGKTTTAVNLAIVLAAAGARVVLVDADLRMPRVHQHFGIPAGIGLVDNLVGLGLAGSVQTVTPGLDLVTAGRVPANPSEMLGSKRMVALLDGLKQRYDFVVVDSAPVLPVSDARALARVVDGVLLVVKAGRSTASTVRNAIMLLEQIGAPLMGIVLNDIDLSKQRGGDLYGYGYGYGEGYGDVGVSGEGGL